MLHARRFPRYEPGNMTSYDVTLVRLGDDSMLIALWPGLHCSACMVLPHVSDASVDYIATKLRVSEADAGALLTLVRKQMRCQALLGADVIATLNNKLTPVHMLLHDGLGDDTSEAMVDARGALDEAVSLLRKAQTAREQLRSRISDVLDTCESCCLDDDTDRQRVLDTLMEALS